VGRAVPVHQSIISLDSEDAGQRNKTKGGANNPVMRRQGGATCCSCKSLIMRAGRRSGRSGRSWGGFDITAPSGPVRRVAGPSIGADSAAKAGVSSLHSPAQVRSISPASVGWYAGSAAVIASRRVWREHGQQRPAGPRGSAADLVLVRAGQALARLEGLLD
jgi:hypothetical protein